MKKTVLKIILSVLFILVVFFLMTNLIIIFEGEKKLSSEEELKAYEADCILILGAGVYGENEPSPMLSDRLSEGLRLYENGVSAKIIVSGDHGRENYDEVNTMKHFLIERGVPSEDIFMDHAGFSTYDSIYRAKEIFGAEKIVIVTQKYHIYRALFIAKRIGLSALGAPSDPRTYRGAFFRNAREWLAREKDVFSCTMELKPKYLGDPIDLSGSGDVTND